MMVASTKVPGHHDACFGQPAIDGLEQLTGQLMLLEQVAEIHDGGAIRQGAIRGIIGQTGAWRRFRTGHLPWHRRSGCTNAACSEYAAWSPADRAVGHCPPWDKTAR